VNYSGSKCCSGVVHGNTDIALLCGSWFHLLERKHCEGEPVPVPDYETLMLPVLRLFNDGATNVSECLPEVRRQFDVTDEEAQELIPSGRTTLLRNRVHWARTYLGKAGLLSSPKRNVHAITELGRQLLARNPRRIDNQTLAELPRFQEWLVQSRSGTGVLGDDGHLELPIELPRPAAKLASPAPIKESQTPEDAMEAAHQLMTAALRDELVSLLHQVTPQRFERMIVDLLTAMNYGGGDPAKGLMTRASGDGGIDGIIHEDALGLDAVYIQAKRYAPDNRVGRPDVQRFIGSLTGEGATKGVFVTTSDFSKDARDYIERVQHRVVLINGQRLAQLMIQHGVGVRTRQSYLIQSVDEDYFSDL
jgi:restriction system protein